MSELGAQAVRDIHENEIGPILRSLTAEEWAMPSACAGWRIQEVVSHMTSNMKMFVSPDPMPDTGGKEIGAEEMAEMLLGERREWGHEQVLAEYEELVEGFLGAMAGVQDPAVGSAITNFGELGSHPTSILSDVFTFDHYCHLRIDMLKPTGPLERETAEPSELHLRPTLDWMMAGLPPMCSAHLSMVDKPLRIDFTGPAASSWIVGPVTVDSDGMVTCVEVDPGSDTDAVATVTSTVADYVSWGTQRSNWADTCAVSGDVDYAAAVMGAINII